ncbi:MAG: ribonuclease III [Deltaproteobacteria bacterium]|nr:ribonuclease III [Deltaproteobacteria bacterium]
MSQSDETWNPAALFGRLGHTFADVRLLAEALTHRSFVNEHPDRSAHNERLEFLGDAVLDLIVAEALMERCPGASEGELTRRRAALVNEAGLADMARRVNLGAALRLGKGEEKTSGRDRSSILSDAVEAVLGAVYLDAGYEAARRVALAWLGPALDPVVEGDLPGDAKTSLQEVLQAGAGRGPMYRVVSEEGPDHDKVFEVEIVAGGEVLARGRGRSKKEAEKDAAARALAARSVTATSGGRAPG